jgi:mono/diheme cytochrome c family protein/uncharacterized membrane protein
MRRAMVVLCVLAGLSAVVGLGGPSVPAPALLAQADSSSAKQRPAPQSSKAASSGTHAARELFKQHCEKCHGADGTGSAARDRLAEIPNFTDGSWQAQRSNSQLAASILDGKGKEMPAAGGKVNEEQARSLVAYVRSFAPTKETSRKEKLEKPTSGSFDQHYRRLQQEMGKLQKQFKQENQKESSPGEPAEAEPAEAEPAPGFFEKLIGWLGKCHPSVVHFPIALLTAAAIAELLLMATGKPAFDAASRYCVWFGTLGAVAAGVLGWFLGGFHLSDPSWVLMAHRWLGTSTVVCAGLILALSEVSRHPDGSRARALFRAMLFCVALLVSVTGFFGGAVVFGLGHFAWPP